MNKRPPLPSDLVPVSRREVLSGTASGAIGLGVGGLMNSPAVAAVPDGFDTMDPETNIRILLKLQADLAEREVISGFGGYAWMWVPGEANHLIFQTYGIGASRLEAVSPGVWNYYHKEVLYYMHPETGEVLDSWTNPVTGRKVEVLHILNDPVNRIYRLKGGRLEPPYNHVVNGSRIVFQIDVLRTQENPISRKDYPLHSQQDVYQSGELWAISGSLAEVSNPDVTTAENHTAWARNGMWLPFMEMGNRLGHMVYHSQSFKMMDGVAGLPKYIREYTEKNYPEYLQAPQVWEGLRNNENTWSYSKKIIDGKREKGLGGKNRKGSVFGMS